MAISPDRLERLHECDAYRGYPLQTAIDKGWTQWWAQVGQMTRTAADMAVWELTHAIEHFFETYGSENLSLRLRFLQERDMDPNEKRMEMLVNGRFYEHDDHVEIEAGLHEKMLDIDGAAALKHLHKVASRSIVSNRKLIVDRLSEAFPDAIGSAKQAIDVRHALVPHVQALVEHITLEADTGPSSKASPRHRI